VKRKWKLRLGVSTVIANMLMILITLSLAAILVAWTGTSYGAFAGGSQLFFQQRGQAIQENFVIEEVFFNKTSPYQIFVFVRNVGPLNINVVAIYVNGTSISPASGASHGWCSFSGTPASQSLGVGSVCEFSLNWGSAWVSGSIFNILVASARGNQVATTMRGP
jgi:FlaG/FlaF family flagellin (archaellin)